MEEEIKRIMKETLYFKEKKLKEFLKNNGYEVSDRDSIEDYKKIIKQLKKEGKCINTINYFMRTDNSIIECFIPFFDSLENPISEETKQEIANKYYLDVRTKEIARDVKLKRFVEKLTELSNEFDIYVGGCGCCGSPYLYGDLNNSYYDLHYSEEQKKYE